MSKVRIQDDLFAYVNQDWIDQAVIPDDRPSCGGFADLDKDVEALMINEFKDMVKNQSFPNDYLKRACDIFAMASDTKKRNKLGIKPALKGLAKLEKLNSVAAFNRKLAELATEGYPLPIEIGVDPDLKNTNQHLVYVRGPSTILPDTTYYAEGNPQKDMILGLWANMAKGVMSFTGKSEEEINLYINDALAFDALIASLVKSSQEWSKYTEMYNPMKVSKVASMVKPINFKKLCNNLFGFVPEIIVVTEPRYFKGFKQVFNENTFEQYKHWAYVNELIGSSKYLSEDLRELGGSYMRALIGVAKMPDVDKFAYDLASSFFSEPVGLYYGEKYFGEEAKKDVIDMVKDIIKTYQKRVKDSPILQDATKEKAILKLSKMEVKMGYPDKVDSFYDSLVFDECKNLYEVCAKIVKLRRIHEYEQLTKPVDRSKWAMPGHMVNACYSPFNNDITFPAAILQAPFYSIKQTRSQNLGGIGAVIGHEISHAFDNNGAKCDENGNLFNWWTKADEKKFQASTKAMIKEFEGIELPWGKVNAELIVSENIADNGGMAVTLDIMSRLNGANYEEYFINWSKVWCIKAKPEYQAILLNVDVHAPAILRANMSPRNFPEWYETFNVKKTDKMYIAKNKRVIIW